MAEAEISPAELKFRFQLNKQLPAAISIHNPTNQRQAFKVKTTTPKKYVVRPSSGVVEPKSTANVQVIMQAQKEIPADFASCKDKFLVQVKPLEAAEEVNQDTFKSGKGIKDTKIRVVLDGPPAPPSPVPEVAEGDEELRGVDAFGAAAGGAAGIAAGEPGALGHENRALRSQLERLMAERDTLRSKLDKGGKAASGGRSALSPLSLLPVLIVGLLAFLLGHYLQHVPYITELLASARGEPAGAEATLAPAAAAAAAAPAPIE